MINISHLIFFSRPGVLTVCGRGTSQVCVQVPPVPLQKILDAPPDKLHRSSGMKFSIWATTAG